MSAGLTATGSNVGGEFFYTNYSENIDLYWIFCWISTLSSLMNTEK
jgi:hypothetical protein